MVTILVGFDAITQKCLLKTARQLWKNFYVDFGSESEVMIKNSSTDITGNCYVDYGSRRKLPIKNDSAESNEKRVSFSFFRISFIVFKR